MNLSTSCCTTSLFSAFVENNSSSVFPFFPEDFPSDEPHPVPFSRFIISSSSLQYQEVSRETIKGNKVYFLFLYSLYKKESLATLSRPSGMRSIYFISARCASLRSILCDRNFLSHKNSRSLSFCYHILHIIESCRLSIQKLCRLYRAFSEYGT